jgi:hypothetical protein
MTARKTIAFWIVAALLFGYWWTVERNPDAGKEMLEIQREKFVELYRDEVEAVELTRDGRTLRAERNEQKRWAAVSPDGVALPHDLVLTLIDSLSDEQDSEVVNDQPTEADVAAFGLDDPRTSVRLELAGGKELRVEFGAANPPHTAIYARKSASPKIYLVGLNLEYYGDLLFQAAFPGTKLSS